MISNYKISIIVPIYNIEPYLRKCLDSIIHQTYNNLEIILVDDQSPDNCGEICDEYAKNDNRIKVIHQKNKGLSGARNSGLKIATGDFIGFVDGDDWVDKNMYGKLLQVAIENNLDVVECDTIRTNDENLFIKNDNTGEVLIENPKEAYLRIMDGGGFSVWRRLYKNYIVKNYEFVLNKTSEDIYFVTDNLSKANNLGYIKDILYYYRTNPTSITRIGYSLTRLNDTLDGGLYLQKVLTDAYDKSFNIAIRKNVLLKCLQHYKKINYRPHLDKDYKHRKRLKSLISKNYYAHPNHPFYLKLANKLSVKAFEKLIGFNKLKHTLLGTKKFK